MIGKFISFEGPECTGKTTIAPILAQHLRDRGYKVVHTREPGGSPLAEDLRKLVLDPSRRIMPITELLLMWAARTDHINQTILPALNCGHVVISERFVDSSYAFQGVGRGLKEETLLLEHQIVKPRQPDHTLYFDVPFEEMKRRLSLRPGVADRIEKEGLEFYQNVYDGYRERFISNPQRMFRIDALPEPETVLNSVLAWANATFENLN